MAREPGSPCGWSGCATICFMLTVMVLLFVLVFVPQRELDKVRARLASILTLEQATVEVEVGVAAAPCPQLSQPVVVVVQAGDSLASIARHFGTTVEAIVIANQLTSIEIFVGQQLVIPVQAATAQVVTPGCPSPTTVCPMPTPTCPTTLSPTNTPTCPPESATPTCPPVMTPTICPTMAARMQRGDP